MCNELEEGGPGVLKRRGEETRNRDTGRQLSDNGGRGQGDLCTSKAMSMVAGASGT